MLEGAKGWSTTSISGWSVISSESELDSEDEPSCCADEDESVSTSSNAKELAEGSAFLFTFLPSPPGPEEAIYKWYGHFVAVSMRGPQRRAKLLLSLVPRPISGSGNDTNVCECTTSRHFEVERKCELIERLDLVHTADGSLQGTFFLAWVKKWSGQNRTGLTASAGPVPYVHTQTMLAAAFCCWPYSYSGTRTLDWA